MKERTKEKCEAIVETAIYTILDYADTDKEKNEMIKRVRKELKKCIDKED